ncbi:MAG: hypothetical protein ABIT10_04045 [Alteraurantiacibacter sp.]
MLLKSRLSALAPLLLLAACNSSEDAAPAGAPSPTPTPVLTTNPAPQVAADGSPLAAGTWQIGENATGANASFVSPEGKALLSLACDTASKAVSLAVANATPGNQTFVLQAGGAAARLDTIADGNSADPRQTAAIAPDAPVFNGFVVPGGTIEISQPGGSTLRVPAASGIGRVFEACR